VKKMKQTIKIRAKARIKVRRLARRTRELASRPIQKIADRLILGQFGNLDFSENPNRAIALAGQAVKLLNEPARNRLMPRGLNKAAAKSLLLRIESRLDSEIARLKFIEEHGKEPTKRELKNSMPYKVMDPSTGINMRAPEGKDKYYAEVLPKRIADLAEELKIIKEKKPGTKPPNIAPPDTRIIDDKTMMVYGKRRRIASKSKNPDGTETIFLKPSAFQPGLRRVIIHPDGFATHIRTSNIAWTARLAKNMLRKRKK